MTVFFTSDNHFGHQNIIRFCDRPYATVDEMNERMVELWNDTVKPGDEVWHLGDFALKWQFVEEFIPRLNGRIISVPGNHDSWHPMHKKAQQEKRLQALGVVLANPEVTYITSRFRTNGAPTALKLCHFPWRDLAGEDVRYPEWRPERDTDYNLLLCGHVHEKWKTNTNAINVGVDQWGFKPVSLEELLTMERPIEGEVVQL